MRKKIRRVSRSVVTPCTPSSPDRSQLAPLPLDYTRLSCPKPNREPVRRLFLFQLRRYIKHSRQCSISYTNTLNFVKNTALHFIFSTLFLVFGYLNETLFLVFDILHTYLHKFNSPPPPPSGRGLLCGGVHWSIKILANEDTLLRTHSCRHK